MKLLKGIKDCYPGWGMNILGNNSKRKKKERKIMFTITKGLLVYFRQSKNGLWLLRQAKK
jgi:hypothetical protein